MTCVSGAIVDGCKLTDTQIEYTHDGYTKFRERRDRLKRHLMRGLYTLCTPETDVLRESLYRGLSFP